MKTRFFPLFMALLMALTFSTPVWAQEDVAISNELEVRVEGEGEKETPATMELSIALSPDKVMPGGTVACSVTLTNKTNEKAAGQVSCRLPAGVVPANSALTGYDSGTNTVSWLAEVDAGQSTTQAFDAVLPGDAAAGATYTFSANGFELSAEAVATVINYNLALSVNSNISRAQPGDTVQYAIALVNTGSAPATGLTLVNLVPSGMTVDNASITGGGTLDSDNKITWTLDVAAGEIVSLAFKADIPTTAVAGDSFTNTTKALDLTASALVTVYTDEPEPDLSISKKVNNRTPGPGASVKYTITVTNDGDGDAYDVTVTDTLPEELEIIKSSITDDGDYQSSKDRIVWTVDVPANDEVKLTFRAYVPEDAEDGDTYVNRARIADVGSAKATIVVTEDAVPKTGYDDGIVPAAWWQIKPASGGAAANVDDALDEPLPPVQEAFQPLYEQNNDLVGWLKVADLVDLPIVQTENNNYYMTHDFDGNEDEAGALFLDERNSLIPGDQHLLIYGHNMKSGAMFGQLSQYRSMGFLKANPVFTFQPVYDAEPTQYVVVAVLDASMDAGNAEYLKIRKPNFDDNVEGKAFLDSIKSFSYYDIPVEWDETDTLLSLVTCSYYQDDGRLLIVARPLREDENAERVSALIAETAANSARASRV